ncbi:MAG: tetratricopeptide repeat protein, partial [Trichodesmium sp. St18_bin1]|nr:tetratricopeptide repeat protein [Trichodesmium sp. St18_bin1]
IRGDKAQNIEAAIAAYEQALLVRTQTDFPINWAATQNNLGTAYWERIRGDKDQNIEAAIAAYEQALLVLTQTDFPMDWAMTQHNLGTAYSDRIRGEKAQNIEAAIAAFQQALLVRTQTDFPINWAMTENNLGNAYRNRIRGEKAQNIEAAIAAYQQALLVYTLEADPISYLTITRNLGNLYFENQNWQLAAENYKKAITAVELSRSWSKDDDRRQEILEESIDVYYKIVQAYVNSDQIEKALEYVERSRSKRLVDIMASNDRYSQGEIPGEVKKRLKEHEAIQQQINQRWEQQQQQREELAAASKGRAATEARNKEIAQLEAQKQEVYKKIRSLDRVLAEGIQVAPLEFPKIQALIQEPTTAILSFYTIT